LSQTVYLVDASIYIFRAYFSIPDEWHSPDGHSVNALYGYTQFLLKFLHGAQPEKIAVAYDESLGRCFRNDIYPTYKTSRALPDEALAFQLSACKQLTEIIGLSSHASERYEADDIIATFAGRARKRGDKVIIVTRDKDLGQLLLNADDCLWDFAADKYIYPQDFNDHFGVMPAQLIDYLSLVGDRIDDIPGVHGIGKKTAARLLQQFASVDAIYSDLGAVAGCGLRGAKKIALKLAEYQQQVRMAQNLIRLEDRVPLGSDEQLVWQPPALASVRHFLDEFGLGQRFQRQLENCYWWQ
jgi:5'-3' exonuclease